MSNLFPLMLVPLIVWIAVWFYLWGLDSRIKRLELEVRQTDKQEIRETEEPEKAELL